MRAFVKTSQVVAFGIITLSFIFTSCAQSTYVYQNGTTYNDYEVATNYRIKSATPKSKVQNSKAPNWKRYNQQNKYKRYN